MIKFIKDNKDMILKVLINQVGMSIFGVVLFMASITAGHSNDGLGGWMKIITSLFSIGFYLVLLYTLSKEEGLKDQIRIESGRKKRDNFRFLKVSLIANFGNIIMGVVMIVVTLLQIGVPEGQETVAGAIGSVVIVLITFIQGMYIGILDTVFNMNCVACLCIVLPAVIACSVGYIAGSYGGFSEMIKSLTTKSEECKENE